MSSALHEQNQISQWLEKEAIARAASTKSIDPAERDQYLIRAEHYADYAWSLAETNDHAFILRKSGIQIYRGPSKSQDRTGSSLRECIVL